MRLSQNQREESIGRWYRSILSHELAQRGSLSWCAGLSVERLDDRLGDCVGELVEHEATAVEIAQLGRRHSKCQRDATISSVQSRPLPHWHAYSNRENA